MFYIKIASLTFKIENRYGFVRHICEDYTVAPVSCPDVDIVITDADIEREPQSEGATLPPYFLESTAVYRKIAERLPAHDAFVMHGSAIAVDGVSYIFTAKSGVGKTTHTRLWIEKFGERAHVLNGDKPVIRFIDGIPYACGTPWRGKENYGINEMLPLRGIVFFGRGIENKAYPIDAEKAFFALSTQIYRSHDRENTLATLAMTDRLLSSVRLIGAECNMEREAADVVYDALIAEEHAL